MLVISTTGPAEPPLGRCAVDWETFIPAEPMTTASTHAVVFDAYGTLFDVHSVIARCDALFPGQGNRLSHTWRSKQLEYTWLCSLMGRYQDFESITAAALRFACNALQLRLDGPATAALMEEYRRLSIYPEVRTALAGLRPRRLAILSNGSPAMLNAVVEQAGLRPLLDAVLSVHPVGVFKPHPSVYQSAVSALGVPKESIAFVSSNYWDVMGATAFGLRTYWINRSGTTPDTLNYAPVAVLNGVDQLADALA
jgi:2-haloacid dehalogenase